MPPGRFAARPRPRAPPLAQPPPGRPAPGEQAAGQRTGRLARDTEAAQRARTAPPDRAAVQDHLNSPHPEEAPISIDEGAVSIAPGNPRAVVCASTEPAAHACPGVT